MHPRPGYGIRRQDLVDLLAPLEPAAVSRLRWDPPGIDLEATAYTTPLALPDDLVSSARCIVRVGDRVVLCHTPDDSHIVPGGRCDDGETYEETACREVHEETGWLINADALQPLGFLAFRILSKPTNPELPHPDFLQVVFTAEAHGQDNSQGDHWVDVLGWEQKSELKTYAELEEVELHVHERAFLDVVRAKFS